MSEIAFVNHPRPIGNVCSLSQAVSSAKEFARVLFTTTMSVQWNGRTIRRMMWGLCHADKQSRPAKSSSSRQRLYTKRHPFFVL
jgi:hypothetical protein